MRSVESARKLAPWALVLSMMATMPALVHAQDAPQQRIRNVSGMSDMVLSPANARKVRESLVRNQAVAIQPAPAANAETPPPVTQPSPEAPAIAARTALKLGDVRFIRLEKADEKHTSDLVKQALPDTFRDKAAVFEGVVQTVDKDSQEIILKAVAFPGTPLRYNPKNQRFEGGISVGVIEVGDSNARTLSAPIAFQVIGPVTAEPETVTTSETAPPYKTIHVSTDAPDPEVDVQVVSNVAPAGETLKLRVRPSLAVSVTPANIQGWGLETADVLVSAQGFRPGSGNRLQVSTTLGRMTSNVAALDDSGMAQVSLRSESTGIGQVSVSGAGLDGATTTIAYVFPWRFLGAALIGGVVGGLLRKRSRSSSPGVLLKSLGIAVMSAAIVVALYVLGINLVGFALPSTGGEVLVFVVAALGALYGTKLLSDNPVAKAVAKV